MCAPVSGHICDMCWLPILCWLPSLVRISYRIVALVWCCLLSIVPAYPLEPCCPVSALMGSSWSHVKPPQSGSIVHSQLLLNQSGMHSTARYNCYQGVIRLSFTSCSNPTYITMVGLGALPNRFLVVVVLYKFNLMNMAWLYIWLYLCHIGNIFE